MYTRTLSWFISLLAPLVYLVALAEDRAFRPASLLKLDPLISHHVILVEKKSHTLFIYENRDSYPILIKSHHIATGKFSGDKKIQGDKKTPEGTYTIREFIPSQQLLETYGKKGEIYGAGAFTLNYPNPIDRIYKKTGSGIWLHSTNDNSRISAGTDSRGCLVTTDENLMAISHFVELNKTPIIIIQNNYFLPEKKWLKQRTQLENLFENWLNAWKNEDLKNYLSHYHKKEYFDSFRKNFKNFKNYKRAVFSNRGKPLIEASHISIFAQKDQALIQFIQTYTSKNLSDTGRKSLYLKQNESYEWRIIHENWSKANEQYLTGNFTPSQRFFNRKTTQ